MGHGMAGLPAGAQTLFNGAALASRQPDGIERSQPLRRLLRNEGMKPFHRSWIVFLHKPLRLCPRKGMPLRPILFFGHEQAAA
jgi:hypothetical protein